MSITQNLERKKEKGKEGEGEGAGGREGGKKEKGGDSNAGF